MRYEFQEMFGAYEHALKRCNFLKANLSDAQADWNAFARALGEPFFKEVLDSGMARTLIYSPPGKLLLANFEWTRPNRPLKNVIELFEQGNCLLRCSIVIP